MVDKNLVEKTKKIEQNNWERSQKLLFNLPLFLKSYLVLDLFFVNQRVFLVSVFIGSLQRYFEEIFIGSYELLPLI